MQSQFVPIATADGIFIIAHTPQGICRLEFPDTKLKLPPAKTATFPADKSLLKLATLALHEILHGRAPDKLPPLDISVGTKFQQRVWLELLNIKPGATKTYTEIACAIGSPKAARAVGTACGANPIPLFIPCHRVVAAQGGLGGFSGGLHWKCLLLQREGVVIGARSHRNESLSNDFCKTSGFQPESLIKS